MCVTVHRLLSESLGVWAAVGVCVCKSECFTFKWWCKCDCNLFSCLFAEAVSIPRFIFLFFIIYTRGHGNAHPTCRRSGRVFMATNFGKLNHPKIVTWPDYLLLTSVEFIPRGVCWLSFPRDLWPLPGPRAQPQLLLLQQRHTQHVFTGPNIEQRRWVSLRNGVMTQWRFSGDTGPGTGRGQRTQTTL